MKLTKIKQGRILPSVEKALNIFLNELLERQKDNVLRVVLFGSVARHEDNEDSDIDVFLLLNENSLMGKISADIIRSAAIADEATSYDTYVAPFSLSSEEYAYSEKIGVPIIENIKREGIVLYDAA